MELPRLLKDKALTQDLLSSAQAVVQFRHSHISRNERDVGHTLRGSGTKTVTGLATESLGSCKARYAMAKLNS